MSDQKHIFKLASPFTVEGVTYKEIAWREPKGRDIRSLLDETKPLQDRIHQLLVNVTELPAEVLDEMSAQDYSTFSVVLGPFLEPRKIS